MTGKVLQTAHTVSTSRIKQIGRETSGLIKNVRKNYTIENHSDREY